MPYKLCQSCQQTSYSACNNRIWFCPYCGTELTLNKSLPDTIKFTKCFKTPKSLQQYVHDIGRLQIFSPPTVLQLLKPR
jgi:ribosomal protein L37AE/L43A